MKTLITDHGKRLMAGLLSTTLIGIALFFAAPASAQDNTTIVGSPHDFSSQGWAGLNGQNEICVVCHTPHNTVSPTAGPLWNRTLTAATYTLYSPNTTPGSDIDGTGFGQPTGVSRLCLSCHDGTIAIDSFGRSDVDGTPFTGGTTYVGDLNVNANIGNGTAGGTTGDLSNDHPVAFTFPTTGADLEIVDPVGGVIASVLPLFGTSNDQMECATCHDVHATNTYDQLLRVDNASSSLCRTCHIK